ncbi:MAG: hypothetical protein IIC90_00265 [Chloroflexi bacterium]|nr:hypothetical protein [Chloroflexota bacterium]
MKFVVLVLAVAVVGLIGLSTQPQETSATNPAKWPPLSTTCHDVNGDGTVDLLNDILGVIYRHGTFYGGPPNAAGYEYSLLYDVNGGGEIDLLGDILSTVNAYMQTCSLVDQQVVLATVATMKYQNCQDALADGYSQTTGFVPNMGIHISKNSNAARVFWNGDPNDPTDQIRNPVGLICTDSDPSPGTDVPDKLIGMFYIQPNLEACFVYPGAPICDNAEPVGFDGPEDNTDVGNVQKAWHTHPGLCVWGLGTTQAGTGEGFTQSGCNAMPPPNFWFSEFGWMVHLFNHIPNDSGRFLFFSSNVPFSQ